MGTEQCGTELGACGDGGEPERRGHARPRRPLSTAVNENQTLTPQPKKRALVLQHDHLGQAWCLVGHGIADSFQEVSQCEQSNYPLSH